MQLNQQVLISFIIVRHAGCIGAHLETVGQVQAPFGATADVQASSFDANCTADNPCWYATVLNSQALMVHELQFQFRATCSASPQCPAPDWMGSSSATEYCAGNGRCQVGSAPSTICIEQQHRHVNVLQDCSRHAGSASTENMLLSAPQGQKKASLAQMGLPVWRRKEI